MRVYFLWEHEYQTENIGYYLIPSANNHCRRWLVILADESDRSFSATYGKEWVKSRMKNMTPFTLRLHEKAGGCSSFILTSIQLEQCLPCD